MGMAGEHEQNLWIQRSCWQNLERVGVSGAFCGIWRGAPVWWAAKSLSSLAWSSATKRKILEGKVLTDKIMSRKGLALDTAWACGEERGGDRATTTAVTS